MDNFLDKYIESFKSIVTVKEYDEAFQELIELLPEEGYAEQVCQGVKKKGSYIKNRFSDEANKEKMLLAKDNLLEYLYKISKSGKRKNDVEGIEKYLRNFYMFLEALTERTPDKRSSFSEDILQRIKINNEYDLQHLLYAALKPLYPDIRREVVEDSGTGAVRSDIVIPTLNLILETKCTRGNMSLKKLTEEIEADIFHYQSEQIIFYVYDKEKIIHEKQNYEDNFNRIFDGKTVRMVVQQPINI